MPLRSALKNSARRFTICTNDGSARKGEGGSYSKKKIRSGGKKKEGGGGSLDYSMRRKLGKTANKLDLKRRVKMEEDGIIKKGKNSGRARDKKH